MNALDFNTRAVRVLQNKFFSLHEALLFLGAFLVLFGITLPWPCLRFLWIQDECAPALNTRYLSDWQMALILALFVLLLLLSAKFNFTPINYMVWGSFWLIYFYMVTVRWVPEDFDGAFPGTHVNAFTVNTSLALALPLSLAAFWLAVRPDPLRGKTRGLAIIVIVLLLLFVLAFFVFGSSPLFARAQFINNELQGIAFNQQVSFGPAPLLLLAGGLILMGEEIAAIRCARAEAAAHRALAGQPTPLARAPIYHPAGSWGAIFLAAPVIIYLLSLILPNPEYLDPINYYPFRFLNAMINLLPTIGLVVLILVLARAVPPGKKIFFYIGLGLILLSIAISSLFSNIIFKFAQSIHLDDHGFLTSMIINGLKSLALLFTLPAFRKVGLERAIRWVLVINALLAIPQPFFIDYTKNTHMIGMGASALQQFILLPAAAILLVVFFHRNAKE